MARYKSEYVEAVMWYTEILIKYVVKPVLRYKSRVDL